MVLRPLHARSFVASVNMKNLICLSQMQNLHYKFIFDSLVSIQEVSTWSAAMKEILQLKLVIELQMLSSEECPMRTCSVGGCLSFPVNITIVKRAGAPCTPTEAVAAIKRDLVNGAQSIWDSSR